MSSGCRVVGSWGVVDQSANHIMQRHNNAESAQFLRTLSCVVTCTHTYRTIHHRTAYHWLHILLTLKTPKAQKGHTQSDRSPDAHEHEYVYACVGTKVFRRNVACSVPSDTPPQLTCVHIKFASMSLSLIELAGSMCVPQ